MRPRSAGLSWGCYPLPGHRQGDGGPPLPTGLLEAFSGDRAEEGIIGLPVGSPGQGRLPQRGLAWQSRGPGRTTVSPQPGHVRPPSHPCRLKGLVTAGRTDGQRVVPGCRSQPALSPGVLVNPGSPQGRGCPQVGHSGHLTLWASRWAGPGRHLGPSGWGDRPGQLGGAGPRVRGDGGGEGDTGSAGCFSYRVPHHTGGAAAAACGFLGLVQGGRSGGRGLQPHLATPEPPPLHTRPPSSSPCRKGPRPSPFLSDPPNQPHSQPPRRQLPVLFPLLERPCFPSPGPQSLFFLALFKGRLF